MKIFTIIVELKSELKVGPEAAFAVKADTAPAAKNIVSKNHPVQFVKLSRPYNRDTDAKLPRIGW